MVKPQITTEIYAEFCEKHPQVNILEKEKAFISTLNPQQKLQFTNIILGNNNYIREEFLVTFTANKIMKKISRCIEVQQIEFD